MKNFVQYQKVLKISSVCFKFIAGNPDLEACPPTKLRKKVLCSEHLSDNAYATLLKKSLKRGCGAHAVSNQ